MNKSVAIFAGLVLLFTALGYFLIDGSLFKESSPPISKEVQTLTEGEVSESLRAQCSGELTPVLTEGPYYRNGSPETNDIASDDILGEVLTLSGYVFAENCEPISGAFLDFWQTDGEGNYDNEGFSLRGHQFTDAKGKYSLTTVVPGRYTGRTPHIHVKVRARNESPTVTTQLFMPNEAQNQQDSIFHQALIMDVKKATEGFAATFNFVVTTQ